MSSQVPVTSEANHHRYINGHDHQFSGHSSITEGTGDTNGTTNGMIDAAVNKHGVVNPHQSTVSQVYAPEFFKFANPGPLGLISFALTTFVIGLYQCGIGLPGANPLGTIGPDQAVFGLAIFYGGAAQFIAGLLEFRVGNTFGCTVHCSYGAFWLSYAMFMIPSLGIADAYGNDKRAYSVALGIYLIAWCLLTFLFVLAALRTNIAILAVLSSLTLAFFFLAIAQFISTTHVTGAVRVNRVGGAFAVISALLAFYAGCAGIMRPETTPIRFPLGEFSARQEKGIQKEKAKHSV